MSIFKENIAYRPFIYQWAVDMEKEHRVAMHWHEGQIDLADDLRQYNSKSGMATQNVSHENNKMILDKLLMLFTEMDASVGTGYTLLLPHVKNNEIRTLMMTFAAREVTHQRAYALAAETFGFTNSQWKGFREYEEMMGKLDLLTNKIGDLSNPLNFAKYLSVVFLGEGISLFGAFACLLNLKRHGLMMGFNVVNEWSLADEQEHVIGNMRTLQEIKDKDLAEEQVLELNQFMSEIAHSYEKAEHRFLDLVFEMSDQEGMSKGDAKAFITYLKNLRLVQLGLMAGEDLEDNPLPWMDYILSGSKHTNFFEQRVTDYNHAGLVGEVSYGKFSEALRDRQMEV